MNKCIMLVDDDTSLLELAKEMLAFFDITVHGAETLEEACATYREMHDDISLIIMDMNLENATGLEVLTALKAIDDKFVSILASGMVTDMDEKEYKAKGFDLIIKKPYSFQALQELINQYA